MTLYGSRIVTRLGTNNYIVARCYLKKLERAENSLKATFLQLQIYTKRTNVCWGLKLLTMSFMKKKTELNDRNSDNAVNINRLSKKLGYEFSLSSTSSFQSTDEPGLNLPKICLPTFSGNYTDWMSFIDVFQGCSVETTSLLSISQKLTYITDSLESDADKLSSSVTINNSSYELAKKSRGRYSNQN